MASGCHVRAMRAKDLSRVVALNQELGYAGSLDQMRSRFKKIGRRVGNGLFVAILDGSVDGWLHVQVQQSLESEPFAEITGLVVALDARRRGLGRALVDSAARWACDLGLPHVRVRSNIRRQEAHTFYSALGFRLLKTQHAYERELHDSADLSDSA
jgi:GNAT superfamily N-acetyltransferase